MKLLRCLLFHWQRFDIVLFCGIPVSVQRRPCQQCQGHLMLIALLMLCAGCGTFTQAYDGDIDCKGKVGLSITANLQVGAGYGGGGTNVVNIVGDCGDGFSMRRSRRSGDAVILPAPAEQPAKQRAEEARPNQGPSAPATNPPPTLQPGQLLPNPPPRPVVPQSAPSDPRPLLEPPDRVRAILEGMK